MVVEPLILSRSAVTLVARRAPTAAAAFDVWLDLSRLLWRVFRGTLSGVDRVELAYAEGLLRQRGAALRFVAHDYRGGFGFLPQSRTAAFIRRVGPAWHDGTLGRLAPAALGLFAASLARATAPGPVSRPTAYLNVSHHPLHRTASLRRFVGRTGARFVPLLHDLIPLEWPEYVCAAETRRHQARLVSTRELAAGVIANSATTAEALRELLPADLPVLAAPLGVTPARPGALPPAVAGGRPFFLVLGTLAPRKNHLLLLHLWRRLAASGGEVPRLVIVGSRCPGNPLVADMLEKCAQLRPHVVELGAAADEVVAALACAARAVLVPSFAEGFSLPVAEALALGAPVLASDIPAHREVGGAVPEYLDPCDLPGWESMVLDYARPGSRRRARQAVAAADWRGRGWDQHLAQAMDFLEKLVLPSAVPAAPRIVRQVARAAVA